MSTQIIFATVNDYLDRMMPGSKVTMTTLRDYACKQCGTNQRKYVYDCVRTVVASRQDVLVNKGIGVWKKA